MYNECLAGCGRTFSANGNVSKWAARKESQRLLEGLEFQTYELAWYGNISVRGASEEGTRGSNDVKSLTWERLAWS